MIMNKEKWIEEVMQSIDNLETVEVSDKLHARILQQIQVSQNQIYALSTPIKWAMAACLVLLIGLNGFTILHYNRMRQMENNSTENNIIYAEYFKPTIEY